MPIPGYDKVTARDSTIYEGHDIRATGNHVERGNMQNFSVKIVLTLSMLLFALAGCDNEAELIETNTSKAAPIIEAIYAYREDTGGFPPGLITLVPDYLDSLPETTRGEPFLYRRYETRIEGFSLEFDVMRVDDGIYGCSYNDYSRSWECGDNGAGD
jgi:hypothetical protein